MCAAMTELSSMLGTDILVWLAACHPCSVIKPKRLAGSPQRTLVQSSFGLSSGLKQFLHLSKEGILT